MKNEKGFSLIEVLVSLALLGIIGFVFSGALNTSSMATSNTDELQTANSLAISEMEYVKNLGFASVYTPAPVPPEYSGYTVAVDVQALRDANLQKVTVSITHSGKVITRIENYKIR
jgi:prepilin-type N-terminal cleavage/methylation domain-containing protein